MYIIKSAIAPETIKKNLLPTNLNLRTFRNIRFREPDYCEEKLKIHNLFS